jgi:TPR repeat protein
MKKMLFWAWASMALMAAQADPAQHLEAAENGDAQAQYELGEWYADGETAPRDPAKAVEWMRKAAEQGHMEAQFAMAAFYARGVRGVLRWDMKEAAKWTEKAAEQGHVDAQNNLGMCYAEGRGVELNNVTAREWFRKAAAQGDEMAAARAKTLDDMIAWADPEQHTEAAKQGDAEAQFNLGMCHATAKDRDMKKAVEWIAKAAAQNHARAQYALGCSYMEGEGVDKDETKGIGLIQKSADQGLSDAWFGLSHYYENGKGVEKDVAKGVAYHIKAAELGNIDALYALGWRYEKGKNVPKDVKEAAKWYQKAKALGHYDADDRLEGIKHLLSPDEEKLVLNITPRDVFTIEQTPEWRVTVEDYKPLYHADVAIRPKAEPTFSLKLYFKADLRHFMDHNRFDTPESMRERVLESSKPYLAGAVEKTVKIEEIQNKGWQGCKTTLTDADWVGKKTIPKGEFLYIIRGMIRLSEPGTGSALGFSLMTNDLESPETKKIMDYIYNFAKEKQ